MPNILINGLKANAGGGKNILVNFVNSLKEAPAKHVYYLLCPDTADFRHLESESIRIIDVRNMFKPNLLFLGLYFYELPRILRRYKIDLIFNFGDIIIPTSRNQIYFFDWAYAVYDEDYIWKRMGLKDLLIRTTKVRLIKSYIGKVDLVLAQTNIINRRLREKYRIKQVETMPTPISDLEGESNEFNDFRLPKEKMKFLFPAGWAPHKNFELIVQLSQWIYKNNLPYLLVLCVQQQDIERHLVGIQQETIINLGKIDGKYMYALYQQCDALLLPSLIESYGLPYIEAMAHNLPIVTSDLDFAHEMCGDLAQYFNPFDAASAGEAMLCSQSISNKEQLEELRKEKLGNILDWPTTVIKIQGYINQILTK